MAKSLDKKKETKKKVEELEIPIVEPQVEETENPKAAKSEKETVEAEEAKAEGEIADAKNVTSQTPAEKNETQPADEKQQDINEELEKQ